MSDNKLSTQRNFGLESPSTPPPPCRYGWTTRLDDSVIKETDAALTAHELIKVRVFGDDRAERIEICDALCETLGAQLVQHIGKLLVLWRKKPDDK